MPRKTSPKTMVARRTRAAQARTSWRLRPAAESDVSAANRSNDAFTRRGLYKTLRACLGSLFGRGAHAIGDIGFFGHAAEAEAEADGDVGSKHVGRLRSQKRRV